MQNYSVGLSCHFKLQTRCYTPVIPPFTPGSLLSSFLSMPHEVKSLPGISVSPAPAVASFSQAPSQPQASQTLTPLAVQAAPQVRATPGSCREGSGQEQGMGQPYGVATGSGKFMGKDREHAVA